MPFFSILSKKINNYELHVLVCLQILVFLLALPDIRTATLYKFGALVNSEGGTFVSVCHKVCHLSYSSLGHIFSSSLKTSVHSS